MMEPLIRDKQDNPSGDSRSSDSQSTTYLSRLEQLQDSYPALVPLVTRLRSRADAGRRLVAKRNAQSGISGEYQGRCAVLTFNDKSVDLHTYDTPKKLAEYLDRHPSEDSRANGLRRLFVLEDMGPDYVEVLGSHLGVDPLVFSEQMNTWHYTNSDSVSHRALPSMHTPEESFTLRYFEIRTLAHEDSVRTDLYQMTHAINRRRIERWRDVDVPKFKPDSRHAAVRRCASFWSSNARRLSSSSLNASEPEGKDEEGWDALILVDPAMNSCKVCKDAIRECRSSEEPQHRATVPWPPTSSCGPSCLILEDPRVYPTRTAIWNARNWTEFGSVREARHLSSPYHGGGPSLVPPPIAPWKEHKDFSKVKQPRNLGSAFDEILFYWTNCATHTLREDVRRSSVNSAYFLLKFVSQHWTHQLELIGAYVSISEMFADEHDASVDSHMLNWRKELKRIADVSKDIHYTVRQMGKFDHAVTLNLERLGLQLGCESPDKDLPIALAGAQKDFVALSSRLKPLRQRIDDISGIANDAANLRASLKGIQDGEQGLRLSVFAAIIFPLTLIAAMFSMSDGYRPGQTDFWVFWAVSLPFAVIIFTLLMYGQLANIPRSIAARRKEEKRYQPREEKRESEDV